MFLTHWLLQHVGSYGWRIFIIFRTDFITLLYLLIYNFAMSFKKGNP